MRIEHVSFSTINSNMLFHPITGPLLFYNHLPDCSSVRKSVCHLSQAYGKDVPEIVKARCKVYRLKSSGMYHLRTNTWHHDEWYCGHRYNLCHLRKQIVLLSRFYEMSCHHVWVLLYHEFYGLSSRLQHLPLHNRKHYMVQRWFYCQWYFFYPQFS